MPEIAEVEIVRRGLEPLCGQKIERIQAQPRLGIYEHKERLRGQSVETVQRRGKLLGLELKNGEFITIHLRMTGHLSLSAEPSARAQIDFDQDVLTFTDSRGFGTVDVAAADEFATKLGPDLFDDDIRAVAADAKTSKSRRATKAVLLDQTAVAGIGNYLADESLWRQKIHPQTPWNQLSVKQRLDVLQAARDIALKALAAGGVSIRDYKAVDGSSGTMQNQLLCYGQSGLPCARCQTILLKTKVAGRGTTFCPSCQWNF